MSRRLRVDWPRCDAHGLCHELLPEIVSLDEWGFPVIEGDVTDQLEELARRAVSACPTRAIRLIEVPTASAGAAAPGRER